METTIYDSINNSFKAAYEASESFLQLGAFQTAAKAIGMIGATVYIFTRIWGPLMNGEPINFFPLMRPFVLLIAIIFSSQIGSTLDKIAREINSKSMLDGQMAASRASIDNALIVREKRYLLLVQAREKVQADRYLNAFKNEDGSVNNGAVLNPIGALGGVFMSNMWEDAIDAIQEAAVKFMVTIFDGAGLIGYFLITLLSLFLTNTLKFVAPLAFAFAIYDGYSNNAAEWFGKYINAMLMLLICKAYTIFTYHLQLPFIKNSLEWETGQTGMYIVVIFVSIVGYFYVPTMANMALSVGGVGPTASTAGQRVIALKNLGANTLQGGLRGLQGAGRIITSPFRKSKKSA
ncbi:hypothetical protein [Xanthocytophaga flava]|uniref:hypothetical protein n=1 Tax=Xanthocytophaga flava TaxID=3048013 RepID=UPI0028D3624D|nr:hypothetical protein [Xanthocytophaga flavus]MDJ1470225.1 hypothetical protein [Xanthocytophaga flavus]